jgi:prolipoprotein diacylglyceryltransferase
MTPNQTHDLLVYAGVAAACVVFAIEAWRRGMLEPRLYLLVVGILAFGAVFSRLSLSWTYLLGALAPSWQGLLAYTGKSILGGLAGAYIGAHVMKRVLGYRESTGDLFAPAVALGMAIGRVGCFLTERIGTPTTLPWGITVDEAYARRVPGVMANVPLHPSFVYEVLFHAAMFALLNWMRGRIAIKGELLKVYLATYCVFRFLVEFVRGNPPLLFGLSGSQLFLVPSSLLLAGYFFQQISRRAYSVPSALGPS